MFYLVVEKNADANIDGQFLFSTINKIIRPYGFTLTQILTVDEMVDHIKLRKNQFAEMANWLRDRLTKNDPPNLTINLTPEKIQQALGTTGKVTLNCSNTSIVEIQIDLNQPTIIKVRMEETDVRLIAEVSKLVTDIERRWRSRANG